jgi:hypothetical protein
MWVWQVNAVLFKFLETAQLTKESFADLATVDGVVSVKFNKTLLTERAKGFTHMLVVELESMSALENYSKHPKHVRIVKELVKPYSEDILAMDILT